MVHRYETCAAIGSRHCFVEDFLRPNPSQQHMRFTKFKEDVPDVEPS